jgi:hypothetical protein
MASKSKTTLRGEMAQDQTGQMQELIRVALNTLDNMSTNATDLNAVNTFADVLVAETLQRITDL